MKGYVLGVGVAVAVAACGGLVEPEEPACVLEGGAVVPCSGAVYTFVPLDGGGTLGDTCAASGCPHGARCAVALERGTSYGVCR